MGCSTCSGCPTADLTESEALLQLIEANIAKEDLTEQDCYVVSSAVSGGIHASMCILHTLFSSSHSSKEFLSLCKKIVELGFYNCNLAFLSEEFPNQNLFEIISDTERISEQVLNRINEKIELHECLNQSKLPRITIK